MAKQLKHWFSIESKTFERPIIDTGKNHGVRKNHNPRPTFSFNLVRTIANSRIVTVVVLPQHWRFYDASIVDLTRLTEALSRGDGFRMHESPMVADLGVRDPTGFPRRQLSSGRFSSLIRE